MSDMANWRDKSDEDLTSEDFEEMRRAAVPVVARMAPRLPGGGQIVAPAQTGGTASIVAPLSSFVEVVVSSPQPLHA
jgi:hypothetical protein